MLYQVQSKTGITFALDTTFNTLKGCRNLRQLPERKLKVLELHYCFQITQKFPFMQKPNSFRKLVNITSTDQVSERRNEAILKEDIALQRQTKDGMIPTHQKFTRPYVDKLK